MSDAVGNAGAEGRRITPLDIQQKEFRLAFRGYNERDVDEFLDLLTEEFARLHAENRRLSEQLQFKGTVRIDAGGGDPEAVSGQARELAESVTRQAKEEADAIVGAAEGDAERIRGQARDQAQGEAARILAAAQAQAEAETRAEAEARQQLRAQLENENRDGSPDQEAWPVTVAAINSFLSRERAFLQGLASLIQRHAQAVKQDALRARQPAAPAAAPSAESEPWSGDDRDEDEAEATADAPDSGADEPATHTQPTDQPPVEPAEETPMEDAEGGGELTEEPSPSLDEQPAPAWMGDEPQDGETPSLYVPGASPEDLSGAEEPPDPLELATPEAAALDPSVPAPEATVPTEPSAAESLGDGAMGATPTESSLAAGPEPGSELKEGPERDRPLEEAWSSPEPEPEHPAAGELDPGALDAERKGGGGSAEPLAWDRAAEEQDWRVEWGSTGQGSRPVWSGDAEPTPESGPSDPNPTGQPEDQASDEPTRAWRPVRTSPEDSADPSSKPLGMITAEPGGGSRSSPNRRSGSARPQDPMLGGTPDAAPHLGPRSRQDRKRASEERSLRELFWGED